MEEGEKGDAIGKKKEDLSREGHGSEAVNQDGRRPRCSLSRCTA